MSSVTLRDVFAMTHPLVPERFFHKLIVSRTQIKQDKTEGKQSISKDPSSKNR